MHWTRPHNVWWNLEQIHNIIHKTWSRWALNKPCEKNECWKNATYFCEILSIYSSNHWSLPVSWHNRAYYSTSCAANVDQHYVLTQTASQGTRQPLLRNLSKGWYMGKEIITAKNGLCSHTNKSYPSGHRIAWIYITSFGTATESAVYDIHT
jgi:hypothetical protein